MILFLDIDGVLHPDPAPEDKVFSCRHLLWEILRTCPDLQVVISSDWRLKHSLADLAQWITAGSTEILQNRFVGTTPVFSELRHTYRGREQECRAWLEQSHRADERWFALDDVASNFEFGAPQLILVDYRTGLTDATVQKALAKLRSD